MVTEVLLNSMSFIRLLRVFRPIFAPLREDQRLISRKDAKENTQGAKNRLEHHRAGSEKENWEANVYGDDTGVQSPES